MPRKTPAELQQARKEKQEERRREEAEAELTRERAEAERQAKIAPLVERLRYLRANEQRALQLESVLEGLYVEMDKLCKKAPADEVTELALTRVNKIIDSSKDLLKGDEFIDSIDRFVAAGERPEHRDVLLILGELRQGIDRNDQEHRRLRAQASRERWQIEPDPEDPLGLSI